MRGIYQIRNNIDNKRYIGKSKNINVRLINHRSNLKSDVRNKDTNRYLWSAVKKHGIENFTFEPIEILIGCSDEQLADRELFWMDQFNTCDRKSGYNLRRDSSTKTSVHPDTIELYRKRIGKLNPNYGNVWGEELKRTASEKVKAAHVAGCYGDEWKEKQRVATKSRFVNMSEEERIAFGKAVSSGRRVGFDFGQYDLDGNLIRSWGSVEEIRTENPEYKWQNIYAACNGNKATAYGFMWRRVKSGCVIEKIEAVVRKPMGRKRHG